MSWCGKKFKKERLVFRENWNKINAVKNDLIFEVKSPIILQPGPAAFMEGIKAIANIINACTTFKTNVTYSGGQKTLAMAVSITKV